MRALLFATLVACSSTTPAEPFTGTDHRFAIDHFDLPTNNNQSLQLGDDLNGDKSVDNEVGMLVGTLSGQMDLAPNPSDLFALLPTTIVINTHDMFDDDHVGVSYIGRPGDVSTPATGTFVGGRFVSERSRDSDHPANGTMVLPLFIDADPTEFPLQHGEIDLQPDGAGGYTGQLRGLIDADAAMTQAVNSTYQMLQSNPHEHVSLVEFLTFDPFDNHAPKIPVTIPSLAMSSLMRSLLAPDITLDGKQWLSFGFQFHIVPCDEGTCVPATLIDHCDNRVQDADETDVDCGGSCHACGFDTRCLVAADCQSGACDAGACRAPTCSDGIQDGYETGVDCGAYGCPDCVAN